MIPRTEVDKYIHLPVSHRFAIESKLIKQPPKISLLSKQRRPILLPLLCMTTVYSYVEIQFFRIFDFGTATLNTQGSFWICDRKGGPV